MKFKNLINDNLYTILYSILLFLFLLILIFQYKPVNESNYVRVTVEYGDTVWGFAKEYRENHNLDSSSFVEWVEKNNYIDAADIKPGQELFIPVKPKKTN
ncbi:MULTISPECIES: cell division suppressor protein YneA [Bacillota]|uniref:cell division suppressor protein YneA n=1 Tax=Bacillota TaxID=1239 RepID=UPI0039F11C1F